MTGSDAIGGPRKNSEMVADVLGLDVCKAFNNVPDKILPNKLSKSRTRGCTCAPGEEPAKGRAGRAVATHPWYRFSGFQSRASLLYVSVGCRR